MYLGVYCTEKKKLRCVLECPRAKFIDPSRCLMLQGGTKHVQCQDRLYLTGK